MKCLHSLLLLLGLALIVGCEKKNTEISPQQEACRLTTEALEGGPFRDYLYDEENRLFRIVQYRSGSPEKRYTFQYDRKGNVELFREVRLQAPFENFQYNVHYNSKQQVDSIEVFRLFNSGPSKLRTHKLSYDETGNLIQNTFGDDYWRYRYDGKGNVVEWIVFIKTFSDEEIPLVEYGNYDDKKAPFSGNKAVRLINILDGMGLSKSNPGSVKALLVDGEVRYTGVFTYTYNPDDFPLTRDYAQFPGPGTTEQTLNEKRTFEYVCE